MFIVSALYSLLHSVRSVMFPDNLARRPGLLLGQFELKTTIPHGTPKGVRNFRTLENYKHATADGVKSY